MVREYELREQIQRTAKLIAQNDPNPSTWLRSVLLLLEELQREAMSANPMYQQLYEDMLNYLKDAIYNRQQTGGW